MTNDNAGMENEMMADIVNVLLRAVRKGLEPSGMEQDAAQDALIERIGRIPVDAMRLANEHCGFKHVADVYALAAFAANMTRCDRHESPNEECGSEIRTMMMLSSSSVMMGLLVGMWRTGYAEAIGDLRSERLVV